MMFGRLIGTPLRWVVLFFNITNNAHNIISRAIERVLNFGEFPCQSHLSIRSRNNMYLMANTVVIFFFNTRKTRETKRMICFLQFIVNIRVYARSVGNSKRRRLFRQCVLYYYWVRVVFCSKIMFYRQKKEQNFRETNVRFENTCCRPLDIDSLLKFQTMTQHCFVLRPAYAETNPRHTG